MKIDNSWAVISRYVLPDLIELSLPPPYSLAPTACQEEVCCFDHRPQKELLEIISSSIIDISQACSWKQSIPTCTKTSFIRHQLPF